MSAPGSSIYSLQSLYVNDNRIRLLRPAASGLEGNVYELKAFSLEDAPPYAALSYSWGGRVNSAGSRLKCKGGASSVPISLSQDLKQAIHRLDKINRHGWLWVDAICINQDDKAEKSSQVRIMRTIYGKARCVYVWLGEQQKRPIETSRRSGVPITHLTGATISRLLRQGRSVWWSRLWVIQEIVSSAKIIVCIGHHTMQWHDFVNALYQTPKGRISPQLADEFGSARLQIVRLRSLREKLRQDPGTEDLVSLLRKTFSSYASDPRDKIFGLLGLVDQIDRNGIAVKYGVDVTETYQAVVCHIAKTRRSLDIIVDEWPRTKACLHSATTPLPSWVPDFSDRALRRVQSMARLRKFHASRGTCPQIQRQAGNILVVEAIRFDVIHEVVQPALPTSFDLAAVLAVMRSIVIPQLRRLAKAAESAHNHAPAPWSRLLTEDALLHILTLHDGVNRGDQAVRLYSKVWQALADSNDPDLASIPSTFGPNWNLVERFLRYVHFALRDRSVFSTRFGFVGHSSSDVLPGDIVVVPFGASVPFVLRDADTTDTYSLVSDCFINGIMNGEWLTQFQRGLIDSESFALV